MNDSLSFDTMATLASGLNIDLCSEEIAAWALKDRYDESSLDIVSSFLEYATRKKNESIVSTLKRLSRLPQKNPKLFSNFNTTALNKEQAKYVEALKTLSFIEAKRNVIIVGPTGTGKTHLAQAIGNESCEHRLKTYFIKMEELKEKFADALKFGTEAKILESLSKYSCLIIDEVGYCNMNVEETRLFFHMIDKMDSKSSGSVVLTSNKQLADWKGLFADLDALECTLDRLWDNAIQISCSGASHRGQNQISMMLDFGDR